MFVHFDSTAVHVVNVQEDNRPEYQLLKTNGIFLNFAWEPIHVYFEIYIPKSNPDWSVTSAFVANDVVELAGNPENENSQINQQLNSSRFWKTITDNPPRNGLYIYS